MKVCPSCYSEMVSRSGIYVCPRNEIGDCRFNGYDKVGNGSEIKAMSLNKRQDSQSYQTSKP
ncbi:hypothetical protein VCO01S_19220 [Vibrio comitans NBRC 102076]|uniref:Uncharacterized protein n=1 Tax=Vibrio comitans NBRC 102076 TaxID=1219078 RepID=A0A4Y3IMK2_9VIBR|nr:hypothetical protein VCO01S_19220 [Vibrio comitans NBRC 102076]